ncbi:LysE family translocator [Acinetobacter sp. ANC 3781]|uniref:LysE family translocator n=1 Tax=Acinetobacter sp. ANC 3781 TaxID=2529835 RepID=UPI00103E30C8|nr:LysE family translocator [Acinetobacter sp. ANC 3781]TCB80310.1 LysE family translocator [Acinetobacter sp. ANC 3781]
MNIAEYLLYCLTVVIMIATPGPVMMLVASAGLKGGYRKALQTIFGTNFASLILITVSILVLKGFLDISEQWFRGIKILGCIYIAYLGIQILRGVFFSKQEESPSQLKFKSMNGGFKQGFLVGISNPKDILFFAAFFPQFVQITPHLDISLGILTFSWIVLDFATLSMIYLSFNRLSKSKIYHKLLGACGATLILIAGYGLYSTVFSIF